MKLTLMVENLWDIAIREQISVYIESILCDEDTGLPYGISPDDDAARFDGQSTDGFDFSKDHEWQPGWALKYIDWSVKRGLDVFDSNPHTGKLSEYYDFAKHTDFQISCYNDVFLAGLDTAGNFQWMCARPGTFQGKDATGAPASECVETVPDDMYDGFLTGTRSRGVLSWARIRRLESN